jgi:hypothetical protein
MDNAKLIKSSRDGAMNGLSLVATRGIVLVYRSTERKATAIN